MIFNLFLIKLNTSKMIFLNVIFLSTLVSLSVNNWLTMWIMMETALFMFIPMISKNKINDQSMKYFIIQSLSSYILVFSILKSSISESALNNMLTFISLMIKIGMPPFHIWKLEVMANLGWTECMVLTTLIKIPPMILINSLIEFKLMMLPLMVTLLVGSISGINQLNLKKFMAYSSVFNLTWMTSAFMISKKVMLTFLMIYSMLNIKAMYFFKKNNLIYINQMIYLPFKVSMSLNLNFLSISGLPPLTGFYPKWIILNELTKMSIMLPSMMMLTSVISIFMYIQINSLTLSNFVTKKKTNKMGFTSPLSLMNIFNLMLIFTFWNY